MNGRTAQWTRLQTTAALLLLLSFCLYLPTLFLDLFADDHLYLAYTNRFLRVSRWTDLHLLFSSQTNPLEFLPVRDFSYWLDFRVWGDEPGGFHASNLLWYVASGLACFWLLRELIVYCRPAWVAQSGGLALCATLLFVVHPAHVEAVAWIASRKDLIAGTLVFLSAAVLVRALRRGWHWREMLVAALLLFAACFGKASAMTGVVFVSVLIGASWRSSPEVSRSRKVLCLLAFWALAGVALAVHLRVGQSTGIRIENHPGAWLMLDRASRIFTTLLGIALFPYPLRFYYDVYLLGSWHWLTSLGALAVLLLALRELSRGPSLWALGVVLLYCPLLVYLQLMPFTTWSLASERFVFVAVAGLALVLADLFGRIASPAKIGAVLLAVVLPCAAAVWARNSEWGDSAALLSREYAMQPGFHNAIRDRIVFTLLPEQRYGEAAALARQVPRRYAADALLAMVYAEQTYRKMNEVESAAPADDALAQRRSHCLAAARLQSAIQQGFARIVDETDVSYNNLLRTLEVQEKRRYRALAPECAQQAE